MAAVVAGIWASPSRTASGHVQPSVSTNNRYIKLTTFADRARLAYVIYIGEIPGQAARTRLDTDRDGVLSEAETAVFRDEWQRRVRDALAITSGDVTIPIYWESADVGLGDPRTSSGAFSLDLVAWLCGPTPSLRIVDTLIVPEPGESEVLIEESPRIEVTRAELDGKPGTKHTFTGAGAPLNKGLVVEWQAGADAPPAPGRCGEPPRPQRRWLWPLAISGLALVAIFLGLTALRRRGR